MRTVGWGCGAGRGGVEMGEPKGYKKSHWELIKTLWSGSGGGGEKKCILGNIKKQNLKASLAHKYLLVGAEVLKLTY